MLLGCPHYLLTFDLSDPIYGTDVEGKKSVSEEEGVFQAAREFCHKNGGFY